MKPFKCPLDRKKSKTIIIEKKVKLYGDRKPCPPSDIEING